MERGKKKGGSIALVAELEKEKEMKMEVVESTSKVCENKGKGLVAENEDSLSQDDMEDIDEHLTFLFRRFAKLKFKKNFGAAKPNRNMVDKSKFKCFNCGLAGHFARKDFITQENDWATDGLDEDEDVSYVNLALMAKSDETETSSLSNQILSCILNKVPHNFKYHWRCKDMGLTHLFFANVVLFFSHGSQSSVKHIMDSIATFSSWSGLSPNIHKSKSFLCNYDQDFVEWFDSLLIPRSNLPIKFLGIPLITSQLSVNDCMALITKITNRLNVWTNLVLSFAGRCLLIKSIMFAIEGFWCNHFLLPGTIHYTIQSLLTRFLWRGNINHKGGAKVAWQTVCLPHEEGGLGLKNMQEWNKAQILGHLLKVITNSDTLWATWFVSFRISTGESISLWFDPWWNNACLAPNRTSNIISQCGMQPGDKLSAIIHNGPDLLLWDGCDATKIKTWDVWNSIRLRGTLVSCKWVLCNLMSPLGINIVGESWLVFLTYLADLHNKPKSTVALCYAQIFCYHIWRERNARAHDSGVLGPRNLLKGINRDAYAKLQSSTWFSKLEVIKAWKTSRDVHAQITKVQGIESFCNVAWKKNKENLESNLVEGLLRDVDSTDDEGHPPDNKKGYPSSDINPHPSTVSKPVSKAKLTKLNEKYGSISKNSVPRESSQMKKEKKANVGHMIVKQLSDRLEKIEVKIEAKKKNNKNGKVGINKHNNYTPDKYAPRKICVKCGGVNHFPVNYKTAMPTSIYVPPHFSNINAMPSMPMNAMSAKSMNAQFSNIPFAPNPYYVAFRMPQMPFNMPYWNNMFTNSMSFPVNQNMHDNSVIMNGFKGSTQMTKDESDIPKSNEIKPKKQKKKANKGNRKNLWYLDSGCSRHMTGDSTLLTKFKERAGPSFNFGDDSKGYTVGYGLISKDNVIIEEVALVDGLKHNLLSISQFCDKGNSVTFNSEACIVTNKRSNKVVLTGVRKGNVYLADFNSSNAEYVTCLLSKASQDESWLWHKKLSHLNFKTMNELVKKELVRGITQVEKDGLCDAFHKGKTIKASFKKKLD
ncbi:hypothetical protein AgCh_012388 [Apium graveolens]